MITNLKGVSSMKLHRDLGITQEVGLAPGAPHSQGRADAPPEFEGPVEADETYVGGLEKNKHSSEREHAGAWHGREDRRRRRQGPRDRQGERCRGGAPGRPHPADVVWQRTADGAKVYTDEASPLQRPSQPRDGEARRGRVRHRASPHERHRRLLVDAQARLHGDVPPDEREASGLLRGGVRGAHNARRWTLSTSSGASLGHGGEAAQYDGPRGGESQLSPWARAWAWAWACGGWRG